MTTKKRRYSLSATLSSVTGSARSQAIGLVAHGVASHAVTPIEREFEQPTLALIWVRSVVHPEQGDLCSRYEVIVLFDNGVFGRAPMGPESKQTERCIGGTGFRPRVPAPAVSSPGCRGSGRPCSRRAWCSSGSRRRGDRARRSPARRRRRCRRCGRAGWPPGT